MTGLRARLWLRGAFRPGWMRWERGRISAVGEGDPPQRGSANLLDLGRARVAPGFCDTLLHGFDGVDCGNATAADLERMSAAIAAAGITSYYASFYPERLPKLRRAARAWDRVDARGGARCEGWHVEGCFLAPEYRGQLPENGLLPPSAANARRFVAACGGRLKMATFAPELPGALDAAEVLRAEGVMLSIGHSRAGWLDCEALTANGEVAVTHLGNRVLPLTAREPGPIGFAMDGRAQWVGVIPDMVHVAAETLALWASSERLGPRLMAQSDCLSHTGLPAESFISGGIRLKRSGAVALDAQDALAGTLDPLPLLLHRCVRDGVLDEAQAIRLGCETPGALFGKRGRFEQGMLADCVQLCGEQGLEVERTWIGGKEHAR